MISSTFVLPFVFFNVLLSLVAFQPVAKKIGLVDKPDARKHHSGHVPLVGGIAIFFSLSIALLLLYGLKAEVLLYLCCSAVLVLFGGLDDWLDINFKLRLSIQIIVSLVVIFVGKKTLHNLGHITISDVETVELGLVFSDVLTVLGIVGMINAFNMVDGIDCLLGGLSLVSFASIGFIFEFNGSHQLALVCSLILVSLIPYILLNLCVPFGDRFKVFMGDSGSVLIGFTIVWLLIDGTQNVAQDNMHPVTALWLVAIPLMDMTSVMIKRMSKGKSPFHAGRDHLHHILQKLGLSQKTTLVIVFVLATLFAAVGIWSDIYNISERIMLIVFLTVFLVYYLIVNYACERITFFSNFVQEKLIRK